MDEVTGRLLREIRADNRSGASEITEKAADCLIAFVDRFERRTREEFLKELHNLGREIIKAQPAMAPLFNLVNSVLLTAEGREDLEACKAGVKKGVRDYVKAVRKRWETITEFASPLVGEGSTILVHSHSATLCRILLGLNDRGRTFSVTCTESRPVLEGVMLARRLAEQGIPVRLIVDSAAFQLLQQVDLILVGADTISPSGVTNKIGTRGLAAAAHWEDVPFYVLAGTEKCVPMDLEARPEEERKPPGEVFEGSGPIEVLNFYFDRTPLELVSGVVTEKGVWDRGELEEYFDKMQIHPVLGDW